MQLEQNYGSVNIGKNYFVSREILLPVVEKRQRFLMCITLKEVIPAAEKTFPIYDGRNEWFCSIGA